MARLGHRELKLRLNVKRHLVFPPFGTKPSKDQAMEAEPSHAEGLTGAEVPAVSFPNWREVLHPAPLSGAAHAG